ncbi:hypothetical protein ACLOJK_016297 [Asimina triloba]
MRQPLHRGLSGGRNAESSRYSLDSQLKDRTGKEDLDRSRSPRRHSFLSLRLFPNSTSLENHSSKPASVNGFGSDSVSGASKARHNIVLSFIEVSLVLLVVFALTGSVWWMVLISTSSRGNVYRSYRRLQEQLITDFADVGVLSLGLARLREVESCPQEYENYVPCFNVPGNLSLGDSDETVSDRECGRLSVHGCLVPPPKNYRIPLRWPAGRDVIWIENVKITAQEVLSSGTVTKRMMMLDEDRISFQASSEMFNGVEDYSHQIAEMIGLPNESNFNQAGVSDNLCWEMLSQQDETVLWKKTIKRDCYKARTSGAGPSICSKGHDIESPYHRPLEACIGGTKSSRWIPIEARTTWPSQINLNASELDIHGVHSEDFADDSTKWNSFVRNYWSLLSPLIFSDHPKRPGDEDPSPPFNMIRNVLDMNAQYGGFNAALLNADKTVWVMNVVPTSGPNYLPLILDRGLVGVLHDWCEAFPTYPRTYDLVHAKGLLSLENGQQHRCSMFDLFLEVDRILRPEGWVILHDSAPQIEAARALASQLRWEARMVEIESNSDDRLLICQKPFIKKQQQ